jgi:hypothetical protein
MVDPVLPGLFGSLGVVTAPVPELPEPPVPGVVVVPVIPDEEPVAVPEPGPVDGVFVPSVGTFEGVERAVEPVPVPVPVCAIARPAPASKPMTASLFKQCIFMSSPFWVIDVSNYR